MSDPTSSLDISRALQACESALERVTRDVGIIVDREIGLTNFRSAVADERPVGKGSVHLSFRVNITHSTGTAHGTLLVPVRHASGLAACLMMLPEPKVEEVRSREIPDRATKDAMLELGSFVAGAISDEWKDLTGKNLLIEPGGCQGVRADVRPALPYTEGDGLWVVRATCAIGGWESAEWVLMLPETMASAEEPKVESAEAS